MDPIALIIQRYLEQAIPEYSVSRGLQPVDIGTLSQNMNYEQDINQTLTDPFVGARTGYFNPSAFDPVVEYETPEPPQTPRLAMWSQSSNEIQRLILQGVSEGIDPRIVVKRLTDPGPNGEAPVLELPVGDDGKVDTSEFDYYVSEASALRDEVYAATQYQQQVENPRVRSTTPSAASQQFIDAGFTDPSIRYTDEQINPELGPAKDRKQSAEEEFTRTRLEAAGIDARDALMKHAGLPMRGADPDAGREGWTDVRRDGSRMEKLGAGIYGSMRELGDMAGSVPSITSPGGMAQGVVGGAARLGLGAMDWMFGRPSPSGDEEQPDRNASIQAELKRRVEADGGPGIGQKMMTGFANFIENNTARRDPASARKNYQQAMRNQGAASLEEAKARYRAQLLQAGGRTPFMDEYMGRAGL